jgi:uncharacterized membrane protein YdbT with pleckstrin-like domain
MHVFQLLVASSFSITNTDSIMNVLLSFSSFPCISFLAWNHVITSTETNGLCMKTHYIFILVFCLLIYMIAQIVKGIEFKFSLHQKVYSKLYFGCDL